MYISGQTIANGNMMAEEIKEWVAHAMGCI